MSRRTVIAFSFAVAGAAYVAMKLDFATLKHAAIVMASAVWGS